MKFILKTLSLSSLPIAPAFGFQGALSTYIHNVIAYSSSGVGSPSDNHEGVCMSLFSGRCFMHSTTNFRYKATAFRWNSSTDRYLCAMVRPDASAEVWRCLGPETLSHFQHFQAAGVDKLSVRWTTDIPIGQRGQLLRLSDVFMTDLTIDQKQL